MARFRRVNDAGLRHAELLDAALALAESVGYLNVTREAVAERCGVSAGTVSRYFGDAAGMRRAIMEAAVSRAIVPIIAQGLAAYSPHACDASPALKTKALEYLANR